MADELVIVKTPEKVTSRTRPAGDVPKLVMPVVPVTVTASPSDDPRSVVDPLAMDAEDRALVERTIAWMARM
jgi:hypothetical protein